MPTLIVLGLVGGVGSGKSYIADRLRQLGAEVVDADKLAHAALRETAVIDAIVQEFGDEVLASAPTTSPERGESTTESMSPGSAPPPEHVAPTTPSSDPRVIDRASLGALVFSDKESLLRLNAIVHPVVQSAISARLAELKTGSGVPRIVVLDVPLLLEGPLHELCHKILYVHASRATRLKRVVQNRSWETSELDRREKNQKPLDEKEAAADYKVTNEGSEESILAQLQAIRDSLLGCPPARSGATRSNAPGDDTPSA